MEVWGEVGSSELGAGCWELGLEPKIGRAPKHSDLKSTTLYRNALSSGSEPRWHVGWLLGGGELGVSVLPVSPPHGGGTRH